MLQKYSIKHITFQNKSIIHIGLLIIIGLFVYAGSINGEFVWDDHSFIFESHYVKTSTNLFSIFTQRTLASSNFFFYRPVQSVIYRLIYLLATDNNQIYHVANIVLHICAALSLYWLLTLLFNNKSLSFIASLLFMVHPIHTPAVDFISGMANPLFLIFMLCSFCFYIKINQKASLTAYALFTITYLIAIFSKENSLVFPVILLLYHWLFWKKIQWKLLVPIPIILVLYASLRAFSGFFANADMQPTSMLAQIPGFFKAVTTYLRLLILPLAIHVDYGNPIFFWNNPAVLLGIVIIFSFLFIVFLYRKKNMLISFAIAFFLIGLLPVTNIIFILPFFMTEHYLYLSSIGFFILIAYLITAIYRSSQIAAKIITVTLVVYFSFFTLQQHRYWATPDKLYERILLFNPISEDTYCNYAGYLIQEGEYEKSLSLLEKAKELIPHPARPTIVVNLAATHFHLENYDAAYEILERFIEHPFISNHQHAKIYGLIAQIYMKQNKNLEAIEYLIKAVKSNPYSTDNHLLLSLAYANDHQYRNALETLDAGIKIKAVNGDQNEQYRKHLEKMINQKRPSESHKH